MPSKGALAKAHDDAVTRINGAVDRLSALLEAGDLGQPRWDRKPEVYQVERLAWLADALEAIEAKASGGERAGRSHGGPADDLVKRSAAAKPAAARKSAP